MLSFEAMGGGLDNREIAGESIECAEGRKVRMERRKSTTLKEGEITRVLPPFFSN